MLWLRIVCRLSYPPRSSTTPKLQCWASGAFLSWGGRRRTENGVLRASASRPGWLGRMFARENPHVAHPRLNAPTTSGASRKTRQRKKTDGIFASVGFARGVGSPQINHVPALRPPDSSMFAAAVNAATHVAGASPRDLPGTRRPTPGPRGRSRAKRREGLRLLNARGIHSRRGGRGSVREKPAAARAPVSFCRP